jgi:hypothetical protein
MLLPCMVPAQVACESTPPTTTPAVPGRWVGDGKATVPQLMLGCHQRWQGRLLAENLIRMDRGNLWWLLILLLLFGQVPHLLHLTGRTG